VAAALTIQALKERLSHVHLEGQQSGRTLKTGWSAIDAALGGGLPVGALHEWFGGTAPAGAAASASGKTPPPDPERAARRPDTRRADGWRPPLCLLAHLAWQALVASTPPRWIIWIGKACFPYPGILVRDAGSDQRLLAQSLFISAPSAESRLDAIDLALRSTAVDAVIADGSALSMAATRRIQLLAGKYQTLACILRPPWEQHAPSCAQTRWLVRCAPPAPRSARTSFAPRWCVELLRCKGVPIDNHHGPWVLEWDSDTRTLHLSSEVVHPARTAQQPARPRGRRPARSA